MGIKSGCWKTLSDSSHTNSGKLHSLFSLAWPCRRMEGAGFHDSLPSSRAGRAQFIFLVDLLVKVMSQGVHGFLQAKIFPGSVTFCFLFLFVRLLVLVWESSPSCGWNSSAHCPQTALTPTVTSSEPSRSSQAGALRFNIPCKPWWQN